jgi:hypothetical protein
MSCSHCIELDTASSVGHIYAKAQAHRLAHVYADTETTGLTGGVYVEKYIDLYTLHYEQLYSSFRNIHLSRFVDMLYIKHKNSPNKCIHHQSYD